MRSPFRFIRYKFYDIMFPIKKGWQRLIKGYSNNDCYNFYYTFLDMVPKILTHFRDNLSGVPTVKFEEVESYPIEFIEYAKKEIETVNEKKKLDGDWEFDLYDDFTRWRIILTRIIYCLQQADEEQTEIVNEYQEEFNRQTWGDSSVNEKISFKEWWNKYFTVEKTDEKGKPILYKLNLNEADEDIKKKYFGREEEISRYRTAMKDEAFDLMKKYFWCLWD